MSFDDAHHGYQTDNLLFTISQLQVTQTDNKSCDTRPDSSAATWLLSDNFMMALDGPISVSYPFPKVTPFDALSPA